MTLATIHRQTVALLKENPDKVDQRRAAIADLARGNERTLEVDRPNLRRRAGVWLSTTQGNTIAGQGALCVQMLGVGVGSLVFDPNEKCWWFHPAKNGKGPWRWSKQREDGAQINKYLEERKTAIRAVRQKNRGNEREIQWQLAAALSSEKKIRNRNLRGLRPVNMGGFPLEIGISISSNGGVSTGNIDLLLVKRGGSVGGRMLVLELKAPGAKKTQDIRGALGQAIRYATALDLEANGNGDETAKQQTTLATYRSAFGLKKSGKGRLGIGVVIAMEDAGKDFRDAARKQLEECCREQGDSPIMWIDMLLYDYDTIGETAQGWRWLEHWPPLRRVSR